MCNIHANRPKNFYSLTSKYAHIQAEDQIRKISDISNTISTAIAMQCQCQYTNNFIVRGGLLCSNNEKGFIFQGLLLTPEGKTAKEIRNLTQEWAFSKPQVSIANTIYQLDPYCSVVVEELGETGCDAVSPTASSETVTSTPRFTVLEIVSVAVMVFLFLVVVASLAVICCLIVKMTKRYFDLL